MFFNKCEGLGEYLAPTHFGSPGRKFRKPNRNDFHIAQTGVLLYL